MTFEITLSEYSFAQKSDRKPATADENEMTPDFYAKNAENVFNAFDHVVPDVFNLDSI